MKAQDFLKLVGEMLDTQQNYFHLKRTGSKSDATTVLIKAKSLEKQVAAVVKEGFLEPDEPTAEQIGLFDEPDAADLLERLL